MLKLYQGVGMSLQSFCYRTGLKEEEAKIKFESLPEYDPGIKQEKKPAQSKVVDMAEAKRQFLGQKDDTGVNALEHEVSVQNFVAAMKGVD